MYLVNVFLIDPDPEKQIPVFAYDTKTDATEKARRFAGMRDVASADVIAPGGRRIASFTVSHFEIVDLLNP